MKIGFIALATALSLLAAGDYSNRRAPGFSLTDSHYQQHDPQDYRGKVLLLVNVASKCGFTPQYKGLQALYEQFQSRGFEILAFPCDQFGHQESAPASERRMGQHRRERTGRR